MRELEIKRGLIYAADGTTVLARNRQRKLEDGRTLVRPALPARPAHGAPRGLLDDHALAHRPRAVDERLPHRLEREPEHDHRHDAGQASAASPREGNNVVTTLNLNAQRAAMNGLAGDCGAAVALDPRTGARPGARFLALVPPEPRRGRTSAPSSAITAPCEPAAPLLDRATAGRFVPGSTFKVITAAAALDTGAFTPESEFDDPRLLHALRPARHQLLRPGRAERVRPGHARGGARELDQLGLLQPRQGARRGHRPRVRGALRLLRPAADRAPLRRGLDQRPLPQRPPLQARTTRPRSIPGGSPSARSG